MPATDEQLLLAEGDDGVELSLYVDAAVLQRLRERCPLRELERAQPCRISARRSRASAISTTTSGTPTARRDVSLLDLELQAEVDKYAAALRLILAQRDGRFPRELFRQLFDAADFLPDLTPAERERYGEAHHFAARFCRRLEERFLCGRRARPDGLLQELRRFYRLGRHAKLRHAQQWS